MPKSIKGEDFWAVFQKNSGSEIFMDKKGGGRVSGFPVEIFLSHSDKNFLRGTLLCFTKLPILKNVRDKRGCDSHFSGESFFVSECRKKSEGNPSVLCFRKFLVAKFLWIRGGGVSGFPVEKFLSHFAEKFRRGTHLCFNLFGYREFFCFRGLCHGFLSKTFCLTMTKKIVGEPFFVSQPFWLQKKLWRGGVGSIKIFRRD